MEISKLTYEEATKILEELIHELEDEEITLSDSISKYKTGMELYNHLSGILKKSEGEVKVLLGEELKEIDFIREEEDEYY